jgi:organic radical activating enzyme
MANDGGTEPYLSCHHLERGLVFWPNRATACCANPATGETPTLAPFTTELTAEEILQGRERIIARHKAGDIMPECQECPRLALGTWGPEEGFGHYPIDEVTIAHFTTCNIRCNYCYTVTQPERAAPISKAPRLLGTFEKLIADGSLAPYATVRFSGGEPTLLPEFEPLLTLLSNHGVHSHVYTNAVKKSPAIIDALKRDKVELILGIDAAHRATYKQIKKMDYNEVVWANVDAYCAAQQQGASNKIWAKFIFCAENYLEAAAFVERAAAAGVKYVYYDFDASRSPGKERYALGPLPEEVADQVAILRHQCAIRGIEASFAQAGLTWLTPERAARVEAMLQRLQREYDRTQLPPTLLHRTLSLSRRATRAFLPWPSGLA